MITNQDRSGWFGASDTATIMGNWDTVTFRDWWGEKCGRRRLRYRSWQMDVGNILEIPIIHAIEETEGYRIKLGKRAIYRLHRIRANYDGMTPNFVVEIKTTEHGFDKVPKGYWMQCQVLMHASRRKKCRLYAYRMTEDDYLNPYHREIDYGRIKRFDISYDPDWVKNNYLPRVRYLAKCLRRREFPRLSKLTA